MRALRATPRGNKMPKNRGLWNAAHLPGGARGGHRRDTTTKQGLLRGPGRDPTSVGWGWSWLGGGVGMPRSSPLSRLTGWYGWDGRYRTPEASPPISPAASPDPNYVPAGTSTSTAAADLTKTSPPEPKAVTAPPNRHRQQHRTPLPNLGGRFRSPLQNHGSSTRHSSKQH